MLKIIIIELFTKERKGPDLHYEARSLQGCH